MGFKKQAFKINAEARYKKALKHWGKDTQVNMIIEEAAELAEAASRLIVSINRVRRAKKTQINMKMMLLCEDIADLQIMLEQSEYIFDGEEIRRIKKEKLNRLKEMLK